MASTAISCVPVAVNIITGICGACALMYLSTSSPVVQRIW